MQLAQANAPLGTKTSWSLCEYMSVLGQRSASLVPLVSILYRREMRQRNPPAGGAALSSPMQCQLCTHCRCKGLLLCTV